MAASALRRPRRRLKIFSDQIWLWLFVLPGIVFFILFAYLPMFGAAMAFQRFNPLLGVTGSPFVGLDNFRRIMMMPQFKKAFMNTVVISSMKLAIGFPLGIVFALMLNEVRRTTLKRSIQTITYLPYFISWVIAAGIWYKFLSIDHGIVNELLTALGLTEKPLFFMGDNRYFYPIVMITDLWKGLGFGAIIYLAALSGINPEIYEAAAVDGAGRFRRIWHISLPSIQSVIVLMLILSASGLMNAGFDQMWTLGNHANREVSEILDTLVLRTLTTTGIHGLSYGAAMNLFQAVIGLALFFVCNFTARKLTGESLI